MPSDEIRRHYVAVKIYNHGIWNLRSGILPHSIWTLERAGNIILFAPSIIPVDSR